MGTDDTTMDSIAAAVVKGLDEEVVSLCEQAQGSGLSARDIIRGGLSRGMLEVGELYERKEYFLPELLLASEAMHAGIDALSRSLKPEDDAPSKETVVLGVVEGDVHEIGKNLVGVMLEAEGYRVVDMGFDVPAQRFVDEVLDKSARVLALSTMMTTTLSSMRATVELARELDRRPLIIVGGAPLSGALAADMGADGYETNAARVPDLVRSKLA
jgi:methanogenic corrinoid protein MtbC1